MFNQHEGCTLLNGPKPSRSAMAARLDAFRGKLADNSIAIIVSAPERTRSNDTEYPYRQSSDVLYLNGFPEPDGVLVISKLTGKEELIMFVRPKDREREIWTGIRAGVQGAKRTYGADRAFSNDKFEQVLGQLLSKADAVYYRFGLNPELDERFRKVWQPRQKPLYNPNDILHEMRLFKTEQEIELMRHAAAISAEAHREAMRATRPGMTEYQIQAVLEGCFKYHGASAPAYGSIVATGNNAVVLHYTENQATLADGDLLLVDAACEYGIASGGHAADITRGWPVNGKFSDPQRAIYQLVLDAQVAAVKAARPGVPLAHVHQAASRVMRRGLIKLGILPATASAHGSRSKKAKQGLTLGDFFMHGTSHWIGLDVHDVGSYATASGARSDKGRGKRRVLEPGMVITVEPGLYFDKNDRRVPKQYRGIGVRIEDDILITANGNENLTAAVPKTIAEIEALMAGK
jgi:Xaa-Pro aminopeptidase